MAPTLAAAGHTRKLLNSRTVAECAEPPMEALLASLAVRPPQPVCNGHNRSNARIVCIEDLSMVRAVYTARIGNSRTLTMLAGKWRPHIEFVRTFNVASADGWSHQVHGVQRALLFLAVTCPSRVCFVVHPLRLERRTIAFPRPNDK